MGYAKFRVSLTAVCLAATVLVPAIAMAAAYPANVCVAKKMKFTGNYCRDVLEAWATWDRNQDAALRDAKLLAADTRLLDKWIRADQVAANRGINCTDTTLSRPAMKAQVDAVIGPVIAAINSGLNFLDVDHARCGSGLLTAAANKCRAFLVAESLFVKRPDKDPTGSLRDQRTARASQLFSDAWTRATNRPCPTAATEPGIESIIDALSDDVVYDTTVSPNVSDASFDTIQAEPTEYDGRTYIPICSRGTSYYFFAKRGTVNKLVMYYQGGGACWDYFTCQEIGTFDQEVDLGSGDNPNLGTHVGFDDFTNPDNPFKDWNIVFVPYCTGDVHLGDAEVTYTNGMDDALIQHRGFGNARVAEKWAREHFVNPEQVFVTGSSAGAYGALLHGAWLHRAYPASDISVLGDGGNGVITEDFRLDYFPVWNVNANLPPDVPGLTQLTVPEVTALAANYYPGSKWAHYSTAFDGGIGGQVGFYNVMLNPGMVGNWLSWWVPSCAWNTIMRAQVLQTYTAAPANYRYYIGTGSRHTMFGSSKVYTDTTGGVPTIADWISDMISDGPGWTNVEATNQGLVLAGDPQPAPLQAPYQQVGPDVIITCP